MTATPPRCCRASRCWRSARCGPSLTYPALEASVLTLFLVSGIAKRDALVQARGGGLPAGRLQPQGEVIWLVDAAAAGV